MSLLNDFFIAEGNLADTYDTEVTIPDENRFEYTNLTNIELESLYDIVMETEDEGPEAALEFVRSVDGGEQLTFRFTDAFMERLAEATPEEISTWSEAWAETEEMEGEADEDLLSDLCELAQRAVDQGLGFYFWLSV